jgi:hypothetical protein
MSTTVTDARKSMSWDAYYALAACACSIGGKDGGMDGAERRILSAGLSMLGGRELDKDINDALLKARSQQSSVLFANAANLLNALGVDACMVICAAVATRSGGIGTNEGVSLQNLARALGIGFPSDHYWQLLAEGMKLGR